MLLRYAALLLITGLVGVLSGLFWLIPNGLMGGALAVSLSAGTIWLGRKQARQNGDLSRRAVLGAGFVFGLLAGILMTTISELVTLPAGGDLEFLDPPKMPFWYLLMMGALYGVALHWSYAQRLFTSGRLGRVVLTTLASCLLVRATGTLITVTIAPDSGFDLTSLVIATVLSGVVFGLTWALINAALDPAWSLTGRPPKEAPVPRPG